MHAGQVVVVVLARLQGSRPGSGTNSGRFVRYLAEELPPLVLDGGVLVQIERQCLRLGYFGTISVAGTSGMCALGAAFHWRRDREMSKFS